MSSPRLIAAVVEEAVSVGDLVHLCLRADRLEQVSAALAAGPEGH